VFAKHCRAGLRLEHRQRLVWQSHLLSVEVGDQIASTREILEDVVVVHALVQQAACFDCRVDRGNGRVGRAEERLRVDDADDRTVDLDDGLRADHLQVEDESRRGDRVDHLTQDVHDVLRVDASE
jgi:hypothetical protein